MSNFACVMAAWCALRSDSVGMLQLALSVFAQVLAARISPLPPATLVQRPASTQGKSLQTPSPSQGTSLPDIPISFTLRRSLHHGHAAALLRRLSAGQFSRPFNDDDRISSPTAAAAGHSRDCSGSHKHGIV
jgi:hypothetical protein